jgi:hypothetical protein
VSKRIDQAIAAYQAATAPAAIEAFLQITKREKYADLVSADGIRKGAASVLRDVLDEEIARDADPQTAASQGYE